MKVSIFNKLNTTSRLRAKDNQLTTTKTPSLGSQWVLKIDPTSQCFRIFNSQYTTSRITFWIASTFLGISSGADYPDQLWRFEYDINGYYFIVNCYYPGYTIQLRKDGTPIGGKKNSKDNELWRIVPTH